MQPASPETMADDRTIAEVRTESTINPNKTDSLPDSGSKAASGDNTEAHTETNIVNNKSQSEPKPSGRPEGSTRADRNRHAKTMSQPPTRLRKRTASGQASKTEQKPAGEQPKSNVFRLSTPLPNRS